MATPSALQGGMMSCAAGRCSIGRPAQLLYSGWTQRQGRWRVQTQRQPVASPTAAGDAMRQSNSRMGPLGTVEDQPQRQELQRQPHAPLPPLLLPHRQQQGWHSAAAAAARHLATVATVAAVWLMGPGRFMAAHASCQPAISAAAVQVQRQVHGQAVQHPASISASVGFGSASPAFRSERAFDVAGFKLAGLLQRVLSAHIFIKILALALVGGPVIWLWGCLYAAITGSPIPLGVFKVYTVVLRAPGARVTEETSLPAAILINSAFVSGMFTFAVLIGLVSEEIKARLSAVRRGNTPLAIANHTLVLGWNRQAPLLLRQMADNGHGDSRVLGRDIVVLADRDKDALDADLESALQGSGLHFVTRRGAPHSAKDLETVSAAHAKTVLLLHPDNDEAAEVHKTATLLGLQACRSHPSTMLQRQRVVLQNPDVADGSGEAHRAIHAVASVVHRSLPSSANMKLVEVNGNRNLARLIAQSAVQPGVSTILGQIAQSSPGAPDFHIVDMAAWNIINSSSESSITYQAARRKVTNAVVCGYISHGQTFLNPPDSVKLDRADKLIVLSHSAQPVSTRQGSPAVELDVGALQQQLASAVTPPLTPKSIVIVGWSGPLSDLLSGLCDFAAPCSEITVVGSERPAELGDQAALEVNGRSIRFIDGDVLDRDAYLKAGVAKANAIILGSVQAEDFKNADARMLTSLLLCQDIFNSNCVSGRPPHVVSCIQSPETVVTAQHILTELAKTRVTAELLQPGELAAGMLLQVAHEPGLAAALSELIDNSKGNEIYLRRPDSYGLAGTQTSFAAVSELARFRGETALGYLMGEQLFLVPHSDATHHFSKDSRIIVLSES